MTKLIQEIKKTLDRKKIAILGFGREGKSTYNFLKKYVDYEKIVIADKNKPEVAEKVYFGENYCDELDNFDIIIKSPGISFKEIEGRVNLKKVTSQTELILKFYRENMIGVTGTKGKSTTSSLIYAILQEAKTNARLTGNIGIPLFDCLEEITDDTILVCEMSSHQLERIEISPHIAVLLNIYEEHLDHYASYQEYQLSKVNIFRYQSKQDFIVYNAENELVNSYVRRYSKGNKISIPQSFFAHSHLLGKHNQYNISAAVAVAELLKIPKEVSEKAIENFKNLPHRLEFVGSYGGIYYYNDSISTIPEATLAALESLKEVDTLLLGGMDRGIHYDSLISVLNEGKIRNIILMYETGKRIEKDLTCSGVYLVNDLKEAVNVAKKVTEKNKICLLSPAAASYGYFKNFEERGECFKKWVREE